MVKDNIYTKAATKFTYKFRDENLTERAALERMLDDTIQPGVDTLAKIREVLADEVANSDPGQPPKRPLAEESSAPRRTWYIFTRIVSFLIDWLYYGLFGWLIFIMEAVVYFDDHMQYALMEKFAFLVAINIFAIIFALLGLGCALHINLKYKSEAEAVYAAELEKYEDKKKSHEYYKLALDVLDKRLESKSHLKTETAPE